MTLDPRVKPEDDEVGGVDDEVGGVDDGVESVEDGVGLWVDGGVDCEIETSIVIPVLVTGIHAAPLSA